MNYYSQRDLYVRVCTYTGKQILNSKLKYECKARSQDPITVHKSDAKEISSYYGRKKVIICNC